MTARGIAARLVARHGVDYATGYVTGRAAWHRERMTRCGKTAHRCARFVLWQTVAIAIGRSA